MASVRQRTFRARLCVFLDCSQLHKRGVRMDLLPKTPRQPQVFAASWVLAFGTSITRCLRVWLAVTKAETGLRAMDFSAQRLRATFQVDFVLRDQAAIQDSRAVDCTHGGMADWDGE